MAKKQHDEQPGREQDLLKKLEVMTDKYDRMKAYADRLLDENGTLEDRADSLQATIQRLKSEKKHLNEEVMFYAKKYNELVQQKEA